MTWVIAHRGAWGPGIPENSLTAFERAIELGRDMVEFDVRRGVDGSLVVAHDPPAATQSAPRLAEALELCRGRIGINVELKEPGYVSEVLSVIAEHHVLLTSFHARVIREARALAPDLPTGLVLDRAPTDDAGADYLVLERHLEPRSPCLMWTVNDQAGLERLLADPAVLGVITDVPGLALELRARISVRTAPVAPN